jgi:hypothetical protein
MEEHTRTITQAKEQYANQIQYRGRRLCDTMFPDHSSDFQSDQPQQQQQRLVKFPNDTGNDDNNNKKNDYLDVDTDQPWDICGTVIPGCMIMVSGLLILYIFFVA